MSSSLVPLTEIPMVIIVRRIRTAFCRIAYDICAQSAVIKSKLESVGFVYILYVLACFLNCGKFVCLTFSFSVLLFLLHRCRRNYVFRLSVRPSVCPSYKFGVIGKD